MLLLAAWSGQDCFFYIAAPILQESMDKCSQECFMATP